MASITHKKTATAPDDPLVEINKGEWNDTHNVSNIVNADIDASAGIVESKLSLNNPTHSQNTDTILDNGGANQVSAATIVQNTKYLKNALSTGLIYGGVPTINVDDSKFNIAAGGGIVVDNWTDPDNPVLTRVVWSEQTAITTPYLLTDTTTYIYFNSSGTRVLSNVWITNADRRDLIVVGWLDHSDGTGHILEARFEPFFNTDIQAQLNDFFESNGAFNIFGNEYSPHAGGNLNVTRSAGATFDNNANAYADRKDPHVITTAQETTASLTYYYRDGLGDWVNDTAPSYSVDPEQWDDGTGILDTVDTGKFTIQPISFYANFQVNDIQYGQVQYNSMVDAEAALATDIEWNPYNEYDTFRGWIIVKQGTTDLTNTLNAKFISDDPDGAFSDALSKVSFSNLARHSSGLVSGGTITPTTGNLFNVAAGSGFATNIASGDILAEWNAFTDVATIGDGSNYISIFWDGTAWAVGVSLTKSTSPESINLGHLYAAGGNTMILETWNVPEWAGDFPKRVTDFVSHCIGALVAYGLNLSEKSNPNELELTLAPGGFHVGFNEIVVAAPVSTFSKMYKTADYGWVGDSGTPNHVVPDYWNDTTLNMGSALVAMTGGYWKKDLILFTPSGNMYYIYGQAEYADQDTALAAAMPTIPDEIKEDSIYIAYIVCQKEDTSISGRIVDIRPDLAKIFGSGSVAGGGSVIDHQTLINRADSSAHTQYPLASNLSYLITTGASSSYLAANGTYYTIAAGTGGGGGVAIQGSGTYVHTSGTVAFSNSNGISFGLSTNGMLTAQHNGITSAFSINGSSNAKTFTIAAPLEITVDSSGITHGLATSYSTQFAPASHTSGLHSAHPVNSLFAGTNISGTVNSTTFALSVAAPTAAFSINGSSNPKTFTFQDGLSQTVASTGMTYGMATSYSTQFAPTAHSHTQYGINSLFSGTNISATLNSTALAFSVAAPVVTTNLVVASTFTGTNITGTVNSGGWSLSCAAGAGGGPAMGLSASTTNQATGGTVFITGNNITIGLTTNAGGSHTLSLSGNAAGGAGANLSYKVYPEEALRGQASTNSSFISTNVMMRNLMVQENIQVSRLDWPISVSVATTTNTSSRSISLNCSAVLYTLNGSTLSPVAGTVAQLATYYRSNSTASVNGLRYFSWALATTLLQNSNYWFGFQYMTATAAAGVASIYPCLGSLGFNPQAIQAWGGTRATNDAYLFTQGMIAASMSNTTNTWQTSAINQGSASYLRANQIMIFKNFNA